WWTRDRWSARRGNRRCLRACSCWRRRAPRRNREGQSKHIKIGIVDDKGAFALIHVRKPRSIAGRTANEQSMRDLIVRRSRERDRSLRRIEAKLRDARTNPTHSTEVRHHIEQRQQSGVTNRGAASCPTP